MGVGVQGVEGGCPVVVGRGLGDGVSRYHAMDLLPKL